MSKLILILIAVLVLGGGGYFLYSRSQTQTSSGLEGSGTTSFTGGIAGLLKSGRDMQCEFSYADETMMTAGTVYVANGGQKVRGDFDTTLTDEETMTSSIIQDGKIAYYWGSAMEQGIKMELDLDKSAFDTDSYANTNSTTNPVANLEDNVEYDCRGWVVDNRMFTPPSDVEFIDFAAMMENSGLDNAMMCATCAGLEGEDKTNCLQLFSCE